SLPRAFVREVTMIGPLIVVAIARSYFHLDGVFIPAVGALLVLALFLSAWRTPGKRAPWDRVARTQVRYRASRRESAALLR
ncbi:MAG TPA: hypothetical protein VIV58_39180, partial [Kofleriaceae bacterium]